MRLMLLVSVILKSNLFFRENDVYEEFVFLFVKKDKVIFKRIILPKHNMRPPVKNVMVDMIPTAHSAILFSSIIGSL